MSIWIPPEGHELGIRSKAIRCEPKRVILHRKPSKVIPHKPRRITGLPDDWVNLSEGQRHSIRQSCKRFTKIQLNRKEKGDENETT